MARTETTRLLPEMGSPEVQSAWSNRLESIPHENRSIPVLHHPNMPANPVGSAAVSETASVAEGFNPTMVPQDMMHAGAMPHLADSITSAQWTGQPGFGSDVYGSQSVVNVPLIQQVHQRDRIVEIPEIHIIEKLVPKIKVQEVTRTVPKIEVVWDDEIVEFKEERIVNKVVTVPQYQEVSKVVPVYKTQEIIREIPKVEIQYVEKTVEVPQIEYVEKIVEVPEVREQVREVPVLTVVDVPVETTRYVPRIETRTVEKIRYVPGPPEYVDVVQIKEVQRPVIQTIEKIVEVPLPQEVIVETPKVVEVPGPTVDIPYEVTVPIDVQHPEPVPGRIIDFPVEVPIEKIVEVPVMVPHEQVKVIEKRVPVLVEKVREVPVVVYDDEYVDVPQHIPCVQPPTIIKPVPQQEVTQLAPIVEQAEARYVYEPRQVMAPVFEFMPHPITQEEVPFEAQCSARTSEGGSPLSMVPQMASPQMVGAGAYMKYPSVMELSTVPHVPGSSHLAPPMGHPWVGPVGTAYPVSMPLSSVPESPHHAVLPEYR